MRTIIHIWNRNGIWISGIMLCLMMLLTAADVCGRRVIKHAITGTNEVSKLASPAEQLSCMPEKDKTDIGTQHCGAMLRLNTAGVLRAF
jgi:hypothetical protein